MSIGRIKIKFEHSSSAFFYLARFLKNSPLKDIYHITKYKRLSKEISGKNEEFIEFYNAHEDQFQQVQDILEDDFSKKTYEAIIKFRKTLDPKYLKGFVVRPQYFLKEILPPSPSEIFIDGGGVRWRYCA